MNTDFTTVEKSVTDRVKEEAVRAERHRILMALEAFRDEFAPYELGLIRGIVRRVINIDPFEEKE